MRKILFFGVLLALVMMSGACHRTSTDGQVVIALAQAQDPEEVRKAAVQGDARAQYALGEMYYRGNGVEQDMSKALEWFEKAARQGHPEAQSLLGVM